MVSDVNTLERGASAPLLRVSGLTVTVPSPKGRIAAVDNVSFDIARGETLCLVGETASGKSLTALSILDLHSPGVTTTGDVTLDGRPLLGLSDWEFAAIRGRDISMIFQEAVPALNPVQTVEVQLVEAICIHRKISAHAARAEALNLLNSVGIREPERRLLAYPHQLSGGMAQRVMIAMALSSQPSLLIADEPTTALDVTVQAQILDLLRDLRTRHDITLLMISHDMGVVAEMADRVAVMHRGQIVEIGPVEQIFDAPEHPYTQRLLAARRQVRWTRETVVARTNPLIEARGLVRRYPNPRRRLFEARSEMVAVDGVDINIGHNEIVGLIGESGSGKSTIGRLLLGLDVPDAGTIKIDGQDMPGGGDPRWRALRQDFQVIFQDPHSALDPRTRVLEQVKEPLDIFDVGANSDRRQCAADALEQVGLDGSVHQRFPSALSGGQKQRVVIARALVLVPRFLVCDEPVSALDVSVGAQIVALLARVQRENDMSLLIVSHDLSLVRTLVDRVMVVHAGKIVEEGETDAVFAAPRHPYTRLLISSAPITHPRERGVARLEAV
ncbi:MAG: ABC transporter ATP-binding protein [Pseudomonadota bacterium]